MPAAGVVTSVVSVAALFEESGSVVPLLTVAVFVAVPGSVGHTENSTKTCSLDARSPKSQVTVLPVAAQSPVTVERNSVFAGRTSVTTTSVAVSGPRLAIASS